MKLLRIPTALLAAGLAVAGCASSDDAGSVESAPDAAQGAGGADDAGADEARQEAPDLGDAQVDTAEQRDLIYTASIRAADPDPIAMAEQVWAAAESYGGFVTADHRERAADQTVVEMTVRIPSEHFEAAMDELAGLAETEVNRTVGTEDVTGQTVDLEAHIATKSASVERVRGLLAEASSVDAILELESELAEREAELSSLESQLASLEDRIALSTIAYTVYSSAETAELEEEGRLGPANFAEGVGVGWSGLLSLLSAVSIVIGVLLPFLPLVAFVLAAVFGPVWYVRRARRRAA
ncbi:hypothetical protein GCM10027447_29880 [Glycomyces halotolerans]